MTVTTIAADDTWGAKRGRPRLVGRRRELGLVVDLLDRGERIVTLVGAPGVGKTALARAVAAAAGDEAGRRSLWVSLGGCTALDDAIAVVAGRLGVSATIDRVGEVLSGQGPLLLVLDDVDGLGAALGPVVARWHLEAKALAVLVTSRMRLGLDDERIVPVATLPIDDAVALFEARARAAQRERRATTAAPDVVRRLVERLDCLPLAIELAAARTAVLPTTLLLQRLEQPGGEVLRAGAARAERERHASLAAAIEVSWQLLGAAERDVLTQCAAFGASFTLEAAEAVIRGDEVLDALVSLHERSLLERDQEGSLHGEARFQLYRSVRAFALGHLDARGDRAAIEARVDAHVADASERLVQGLTGPAALETELRLERERDQMILTHRRATELAPAIGARVGLALAELSALRGVSSTALHEITRRSARASGDPALVIRALVSFAIAAARLGHNDEPRRALDEAVALARAEAPRSLLAQALFARGRFQAQHGLLDEADVDLAEAGAEPAALDDPYLAACVKNVQGCVAEIRGDLRAAVRAFEAARTGFRCLGSDRMEAAVLGNLGVVREAEGRREDSRRLYETALERAVSSGNRVIEADTRMNLGSWYLGEGDLEKAASHLRLALPLQRRLGNRRFEGLVVCNLAMAAHGRGELRAARDLYQEGLETLRECGEVRFAAMVLPFAAAAEAALGLQREARADFEDARQGPPSQDPAWPIVIDTLESFLILGEARGAEPARRREAEQRAAERLARARERLDGDPRAARRHELSFAVRLLAQVIEPAAAPPPAPIAASPALEIDRDRAAPAPASGVVLVVSASQRWFAIGDGKPADLSRRGPLRLIFGALLEQRKDARGVGVGAEQLFAAGWPGQKAMPHAAANRVYSAVATLRRLGLEDVLRRHDDGYLLDPAVILERRDP
jgi:predicted ATPase